MFRTAILRTARAAIRPIAIARPAPVRIAAPRFHAVRFYSAGGSLEKGEVEGRIMSLLQGFDKVSALPLLQGRVKE